MADYKLYLNTFFGHSVNDTIPSAVNKLNYLRIDIDTGNLYRSDNTNWVQIANSNISDLDALTDVDLTSDTPDNNDVLTFTTTGNKWIPAPPPGAGGGEANTLGSVGTGEGILPATKVGTILNMKSLKQGTNITLTNNTNDVTIDAPSTMVKTDQANIFGSGVDQRFRHTFLSILDSDESHRYIVNCGNITANRAIILPALSGNDTFVFAAHQATFTNKTFDADGTGNSITNIENADIKAGAAIAYSKLALSNSIVNADINASAAIAVSKIAPSGTNGQVLTTVAGATAWANATAGSFTRENFEYIVYHDGTAYVALDGATGTLHATTSTTDAAAVINAVINSLTNGGKVYLGVGTFLTRTKLNVKTKIHIQGCGEATIIKQDNTQNLAAVIEGDSFTTLTGGGTNGGPHSVYLSDFVIEGNKANNTSTATDGIRYYGYNWHLNNIHIRDCRGRGMYSEWDDDPLAPNLLTSMESYYSNIRIHDCGSDGWLNRGPHDWEGEHITIYDNDGHGYVQEYSAGLYDGGGFVDTMHCYANDGLYGIWIKGGTLHGNRITTESCANATSGVNGIGTYINGGGLDCSDLWSFGQDKGLVYGSGSPSQVVMGRIENNKVLGVEILMNDTVFDGVVRNNNNGANTSGTGIKIGGASGVAVCRISGYLANHKTTNIEWANSGNNGVIITPMVCYTNATYPNVLTGTPNLKTCSVSIENHADNTPKDYRFSVVTYDQIQKGMFHRIDGQCISGANVMNQVGILAGVPLTGGGTTTFAFDQWEGRQVTHVTTTTADQKAGLNNGTGALSLVARNMNPRFKVRCKIPTVASSRFYVGLSTATALPVTNTPLANADSGVFLGWRSTDTAITLFNNDGSAAMVTATVGAANSVNNSWHTYEFQFDEITGSCLVFLDDVKVATLTTRIPSTSAALIPYACVENTTTTARSITWGQILLEKDFIA